MKIILVKEKKIFNLSIWKTSVTVEVEGVIHTGEMDMDKMLDYLERIKKETTRICNKM